MRQHTSDPAAQQNPVQENTGGLASDSLAAESVREGGAFASNPNATPSGVPGSKSTLATTDTSAATQLDSAPDATAREEREAWGENADLKGPGGLKYAEAVGGQPDFGGAMGEGGYAGAPSGSSMGAGSGAGSGSGGGTRSNFESSARPAGGDSSGGGSYGGGSTGGSSVPDDAAPGYITSVMQGGDGKAKGKDLTEGGFEGEPSNVGQPPEIGSKDDPGRAALQGFQNQNARAAGDIGAKQTQLEGQSGYDPLKSDEAA